jgi:hypothetical protein
MRLDEDEGMSKQMRRVGMRKQMLRRGLVGHEGTEEEEGYQRE